MYDVIIIGGGIAGLYTAYKLCDKYKKLYTDINYGCVHFSPTKFHFTTFLKTQTWECSPMIPKLDINHIQKLIKFIALCNRCHEVKHIGKAQIDGHFNRAEEWFRTINNITNPFEVQYRIAQAFDLWAERSQHQWQIDMTVLKIGDETNGK